MTPGSGSLVWLCIILQISTAINRVTPSRTRERRIRTQGYTAEALERLSQVFGIDQVPSLTHHRSPPEYMLELYHSVAYSDGVSRKANPYDADVVRGFPDRGIYDITTNCGFLCTAGEPLPPNSNYINFKIKELDFPQKASHILRSSL